MSRCAADARMRAEDRSSSAALAKSVRLAYARAQSESISGFESYSLAYCESFALPVSNGTAVVSIACTT